MTLEEQGDEQWMLNVQEFLDTCNIESNRDQQQQLKQLESTDIKFHQYALVKQIRSQLETHLSTNINAQLHDEVEASQIHENILNSENFEEVSTSIVKSVIHASENIAQILKTNTFGFNLENEQQHVGKSQKEEYFYPENSVCSTIDRVDFMFINPDQYSSISESIQPKNSIEKRSQGLAMVLQIPLNELINNECWPLIREGLLAGLDDDSEEINIRVLKIIATVFVSGNSFVLKELLFTLIDSFIEYFNDTTSHMVSIDAGLDLGDRRNILLLRKFRLLNQIMVDLPVYWLRYSKDLLEEISDKIIELFCIVPLPIAETVGKNLMTPMHFNALLDPKATWFQRWLHSCHGRTVLIMSIKNNMKFLKALLKNLILASRNFSVHFPVSFANEYINYCSGDIKYIYFVHTLSVMGKLLFYNHSCSLFNFKLNNGAIVSINSLTERLVSILANSPDLINEKYEFHPALFVIDLFQSLSCKESSTCKGYLCDENICRPLLQACIKEGPEGVTISFAIVQVLMEITECNVGRQVLLSLTRKEPGYINLLNVLLNTKTVHIEAVSFLKLFELTCKIFSTSEGVLHFVDTSSTLQIIAYVKEIINKETPDTDFINRCVQCLLQFAFTPKGVHAIDGILKNCAQCLFDNKQANSSKYYYLLSQLCCHPGFVEALIETGNVEKLVADLWEYLEGGTNDYSKITMQEIAEDLDDHNQQMLFNSLVALMSSFPALKLLLSTMKGDADDNTPRTLHQFFQQAVFSNDLTALVHCEQTHYFGLNVLSVAATSLDCLMYLEATYDLQCALMQMQEDGLYEGSFLVDQCLLKRNQILVSAFMIGGDCERTIPSTYIDNGVTQTIFCSPPVPQVYRKKNAPEKGDSLLSTFLETHQEKDILETDQMQQIFLYSLKEGDFKDMGKFLLFVLKVQDSTSTFNQKQTKANIQKSVSFSKEEKCGMDLIIEYGAFLSLFTCEEQEARSGLENLLVWCESAVCNGEKTFDWFASVIFLVLNGNTTDAKTFLQMFHSSNHASLLWSNLDREKLNGTYTSVCHHVELLIEKDLPQVHVALQMSSCPAAVVCHHWTQQHFLNYLNFPDVVAYTSMGIALGSDYLVYFCVAIFKHLEHVILGRQQCSDLLAFFKTSQIIGFQTRDYIDYMNKLCDRYRSKLSAQFI